MIEHKPPVPLVCYPQHLLKKNKTYPFMENMNKIQYEKKEINLQQLLPHHYEHHKLKEQSKFGLNHKANSICNKRRKKVQRFRFSI